MTDSFYVPFLVAGAVIVGAALAARRYSGLSLAAAASGVALLIIALTWTGPPPEVRVSAGALGGALMSYAADRRASARPRDTPDKALAAGTGQDATS